MKGLVILRMLGFQKDVIWQDLATISFLIRGEFPLWSNTKPMVCLVFFFFFWESLLSLKDMTHTWFLKLDFTECVISTGSDQMETYVHQVKGTCIAWRSGTTQTIVASTGYHPRCSTVSCFVCVHFWKCVIETQLVVDKDVVVRVGGGYFQDGILSVSCVQFQLSLFACNPAEVFSNEGRRGSCLWTCFCLSEARRTFNLVNAEQPQPSYMCLVVSTQGSL